MDDRVGDEEQTRLRARVAALEAGRARAEARQRLVREASQLVASTQDYMATLRRLVRLGMPAIYDGAAVDLLGDGGEIECVALCFRDPVVEERWREICCDYPLDPHGPNPRARAIRTGEVVFRPALEEPWPLVPGHEAARVRIARDAALSAIISVPIRARCQVRGAVTLVGTDGRRFDEADLALAETLANLLGLALTNARLYLDLLEAEDQARRHAARLAEFDDTWRAFAEASLDLNSVMDAVVRRVGELVGDACTLRILSEDDRTLDVVAIYHRCPQTREFIANMISHLAHGADEGLNGQVMATGEPIYWPVVDPDDYRRGARQEYWPWLDRPGLHSMILVPLRVGGRSIGVLGLSRDTPGRPYTPDDLLLVQDLADHAALVVENARLYRAAQRTEQRLRESIAVLETLFAAAPIGMAVFDRDLRYIYVNQTVATLNGVPIEGHLGRRISEVLPDLEPDLEPLLRSILDTGRPVTGIVVHGQTPALPGVRRTWHVSYYPVNDGDRPPIGIAAIVTEVGKGESGSAALAQEAEQLRAVVEHLPDLILRVDRSLACRYLNPAVERATGLPRQALAGRTLDTLGLPHELREAWRAGLAEV
ncbi:MAG: GAF domain-containing protein, partial [Thermomicrobiaceae bacterium]|nr:GAF domain-containing protein [Thermomicrobiaceae bacterium]